MNEGIEVIIYSLSEGQTIADVVRGIARLQPTSIVLDAAGPNRVLYDHLRLCNVPVKGMRKGALERWETGTPYLIEGPDDELAAQFNSGTWRGQYFVCEVRGARRAYEFTEVHGAPSGICTFRWVRVEDPKVLRKLRCIE